MMIRIAITGPESSGKTALSEYLASRIESALLLPEYAREYLEAKPIGYEYSSDEVVHCAEVTHQRIVEALSQRADVLICDTDFYVLDIWHRVVFGEKNQRIMELKQSHWFDLYYLCKPDIPWEYDPLRVDEHNRDELYALYEQHIKSDNNPYYVVQGNDELRHARVLNHLLERFPSLKVKEKS
ncbi:MAG TPA: ATP-binding protein [Flavobacteriales bacterium]